MIALVYGNDIFQAKQHIQQLIQKTGNDTNQQKIDGSNIEPPELQNLLQPFQLFSQHSTIIIKNPLLNKRAIDTILIEYIQKPHQNIDLIIWQEGNIDKRKSLYKTIKKLKLPIKELSLPKKFQMNRWIDDYCRQQNIQITPDAINLLAQSHSNTYQLHQEITKLKIFTDNHITADAIQKISPPSLSNVIFDLTDQIGIKSPQAFLTAKKLVIQGEYPLRLLAALATHIANLICIKELNLKKFTPQQIKNTIKLHPFVIEKGIQQCRNFTLTDLKNIYSSIAQSDINLKTGQEDFAGAMFSIINFDQEKIAPF